jgi:hypothetical protein
MFVTEKYMELFKETVFNRLEKHENNFRDLVEKVKGIELSQIERKKRLRGLKDVRTQGDSENVELGKVREIFFDFLQFRFGLIFGFDLIF